MFKFLSFVFSLFLFTTIATAQHTSPPSPAELAEITERGKELFAYDRAAWHASDAVVAVTPAPGHIKRYIGRRTSTGWTVAFGRINDERTKFLIAYEAIQGASPTQFTVKKLDPVKADDGFFLFAAKAAELAQSTFKGQPRPYNLVVLPAPGEQFYVYLLPAQTEAGVFPLGGDVRYLISKDGTKIVATRQMHRAIIEFKAPAEADEAMTSFHIAVLDDIPEDSDVFHVLARTPSIPELVGTDRFLYQIEPDGKIVYLMTREAFMKIKDK